MKLFYDTGLSSWSWGNGWFGLFRAQPEFVARFDKWDDMNGWNWYRLLMVQPNFADRCDWSKLGSVCWKQLLAEHPDLATYLSHP
jgi:hypothetical protein